MFGLDISFPAFMSIVALIFLIAISCVNEKINVGFLGIGLGLLVGGLFANIPGNKAFGMFATSTFMLLASVTFMFGMAQTNGTLQKLTDHALRLCGGNVALVPLMIFVLSNILATIGPGNIAACALMAPLTMAIANKIKMPMFLMTLILVGSTNGAALSPLAPTGIIGNTIIGQNAEAMGIPVDYLSTLGWKIHLNSEIAQGFVTLMGFLLMGGLKWLRESRGSDLDINTIAPKPEPFTKHQWITLMAMIALVVLVVVPGLPGIKGTLPKWITNITTDVGTVAFILSIILMCTGSGDSQKAIKVMPWGVIMMVCGVMILIEVMDATGGLNFLVEVMTTVSGPVTITFWVTLVAAIISAYSSSSGVVMPTFLSMAPGLVELTGCDPVALCSSICVGAHLVDTSPLSGMGAMCLAAAAEYEDASKLFRKLLIWGFSMSIVSAIICFLFFGILGL